MRHTGRLLLALSATILVRNYAWTAQVDHVVVERGVKTAMRDGVVLRSDIYRPNREGRFPVLLQRTPYNKSGEGGFGYRAAASGYVVVIQDVRGRYTSDGEWRPFQHESQDGYDTVEWVASLPYSNGKVGMFGGSYVGATQMLTAIAHPPHLAGICPVVTASNYHNGWTYQGGAFEQWFNESWTSGLAQDTLNRIVQKDTNAMKGIWKLPLAGYPLFNSAGGLPDVDSPNELAPYFLDWLAHPNYDEYWKRLSIEEHYPDIKVPALTIAAWYDIFQGGSLRNYIGISTKGGSEEAKRGQRLLVVIGGHAGSGRKIGDVDFGPAAAEYDEDEATVEWYEYLFKGIANQFGRKPVRIFVMGANQWRDEDDWPLKRARDTKYFLHSRTGANSLRGDGGLSMAAPHSEPPDHYLYDPSNPIPTIGGPLCCDSEHLPPGPRDQRPDESREDVLVYTTEAFTHDVEVTGPIALELYAKSSAVDTDFTAKLVDVWPNGFAQNLTEGIIRARYRDSEESPELMNPGQVYKFAIDLWSTSNLFRSGHRLRLEIGSSNFPRFDRNLNTGQRAEFESRFVSATNTIYHDAEHPSAIVLPIVP
jgi:uncharacterized protein